MMTLAAFLRGSQEISIAGTTSLVPGGPYVNIITATLANLKVRLPDATKLRLGRGQRWIANVGSNSFTVRDGASNDLVVLSAGQCADFHLAAQANAAGVWNWELRTVNSVAGPSPALLGYLIGGSNTASPNQGQKTTEWNPQVQSFTTKTDSAFQWQYANSFVIGPHGYINSGITGSPNDGKTLEQYDPDVHTTKASVPPALEVHGAAEGTTISGEGYMTAGQGVTGNGRVGKYNEGSDAWTQLADRPTNQHPGSAGWLSLTAGTAVCFGTWGTSGCIPNNRTDLYTAAGDSWAQKTTRPGPITQRFGNAQMNGKGYTFGGDFGSVGTIIPDTYEYDQAGDAWATKASFPATARTHSTAFPLANLGYVMGGASDATNAHGTVGNYEFDGMGNTWTQKLDLPHDRGVWQNHGMAINA